MPSINLLLYLHIFTQGLKISLFLDTINQAFVVIFKILFNIQLDLFIYSNKKQLQFHQNIMARITVEDCIKQVRNQYDLVILAKERTVQLGRGAAPSVDPENDKKTVIALRAEIPMNKNVKAATLDRSSESMVLSPTFT